MPRLRRSLIAALLLVVLPACGKGVIYNGPGDDAGGGLDAGPRPDGAQLSDGAVQSDGALLTDAASTPDAALTPDAAPTPDAATGCTATGCQANAWCDPGTGQCACLTGFQDNGSGTCVALDPGDPAARTRSDMCTRWLADHQTTATTVWTAGPTTCDPGTLSAAAIADAVGYVNLYRFLTGLSPLADDPTLNEDAQWCAILQDAMGHLDHTPDPSEPCYTTTGASASSSSNLALGPSNPARSIDLFIDDSGVSSLGHRRWVLNPSYGPAGVGHAGNASCLYVFSWSNSSSVDFVAWPNQGFTPYSVMPSTWSFGSTTYSIGSTTEVAVRRLSDSADLTVSYTLLAGGYAMPTIGFSPSGWTVQVDEIYEVTIQDPTNGPLVVYQVKPVNCP